MKNQYLILFFFAAFFSACNNINTNDESSPSDLTLDETTLNLEAPNETNTISPDGYATGRGIIDLKNIKVPNHVFEIDGNKAKTIEIKETGTTIEIPKNAFVDQNGKVIKGKVNISFKEYHDVGDIIASGIPMRLTAPDGSTGFMQSAGMFDIQGSAEGKPIFIAEDKKVDVNLASYHNDTDYDFWSFDRKNKQWLNKGLSKVKKNAKKIKTKNIIAKKESIKAPVQPYKFDKKKPVLEFDINYENFPELKEMGGVMWQYAGGNDAKNPVKNKWVLRENWDAAEIEPYEGSNLFRLTLKNKNKEFVTTICPSQNGEEFQKSMAAYSSKLKEYEKNKLTINELRELAESQADFIRSYSLDGFGIYNYDIMTKDDTNIPILADFDFDLMITGLKSLTNIYMITGDRNVVVYPPNEWKRMRINPNVDTKLVALLPGNKYATISSEEFKLLLNDIRNSSNSSYTFKMHVNKQVIASLDELKYIINQLS